MSEPRSEQNLDKARRLLAGAPVIRTCCDLDLLVFLYRHPRVLINSDRLAAFIGHDINDIARSLEALIASGLLERSQKPMHAARMYLLTLHGPEGGRLSSILELALTRQGRHDVLTALDNLIQAGAS